MNGQQLIFEARLLGCELPQDMRYTGTILYYKCRWQLVTQWDGVGRWEWGQKCRQAQEVVGQSKTLLTWSMTASRSF